MADEELKKAIQEAVHSWMDDKYAELGKWAMRSLAAMLFAALIGFIVQFKFKGFF